MIIHRIFIRPLDLFDRLRSTLHPLIIQSSNDVTTCLSVAAARLFKVRLSLARQRTPLFASQSARYISTQNDNKLRRQIGGPINAIGDEEKISPGKFFGIDPELYVLFGLVMGVCFSGGYLVGRKFMGGKPIDQITLADDVAYPWEEKDSSPENKYYKYKYKRPSDGATVAAPSAMTEMIVEVDPIKSKADPSLRLKEH